MSLFIFVSCTSKKGIPPLKTVDKVDVNRFMGRWYVIANIPTFIEKNAHNAIETYTFNQAKSRIDVDFRFYKNSFNGELKSYPQKAFIHNYKTNAEWRIQPIWPLKFAYLIIDLAPDYSYTVVAVPDRDYLWIMARGPQMKEEQLQKIKQRLEIQQFDISKIKRVPQKHQ